MVIIALIFLAPFYISALISFRPPAEITSFPMKILPVSITSEHYKTVFSDMNILRHTMVTVFMTVINIATNLTFASLAAYAFAKINFKFKKIIFKTMIAAMMLPGIVMLIPTYIIVIKMNLTDTILGVIVPGTVGVYGIFFLRSFFLTQSDELGDAGRIDGASEIRIFATIYVPLIIPAMITLGIFCLQGVWNSYLWPSIILLNNPGAAPLAVALRNFGNTSHGHGPLMAAAIISALPLLIVFMMAQKYFISGVAVGGLKG